MRARRRLGRGVSAVVCVIVIGGVGAGAGAARPFPARLLVYATEWSLSPSRASVPAGRVVVQLWNRGMDPHDLRVRRLGGGGRRLVGRTQRVALTTPGSVTTARWTLAPGLYELYCSMPGHMRRGMHTRLRVTR